MKVVVPFSNHYIFLADVFAKLFNKYWPNQEVILLCNTGVPHKLPDNFEVVNQHLDDTYWTNGLKKYIFDCLQDDYFVIHLEDHILCDYVKLDKLSIMENEVINGADKAMLHSLMNNHSDLIHTNGVMVVRQNVDFRNTIHTAIWSTEYVLKNLHNNQSVWQFESTLSTKNDGARIVTMQSANRYHDHICNFINLYRSGKIDTSITGLEHEEDLEILLTLPLDEENRKVLIQKTNNKCPQCHQLVDRLAIKEKPEMKLYEKHGLCMECQNNYE